MKRNRYSEFYTIIMPQRAPPKTLQQLQTAPHLTLAERRQMLRARNHRYTELTVIHTVTHQYQRYDSDEVLILIITVHIPHPR